MAYRSRPARSVKIRSKSAIERRLAERDLNGSDLAKLANTSVANISNIRNGKVKSIRSDTARSIERALKVEHGTLFDFEDDDLARQVSA